MTQPFRVMGRKKFYESVSEMQADLDVYLQRYNNKRPHQGRGMNGRTPYAVFAEGMPEVTGMGASKTQKTA